MHPAEQHWPMFAQRCAQFNAFAPQSRLTGCESRLEFPQRQTMHQAATEPLLLKPTGCPHLCLSQHNTLSVCCPCLTLLTTCLPLQAPLVAHPAILRLAYARRTVLLMVARGHLSPA